MKTEVIILAAGKGTIQAENKAQILGQGLIALQAGMFHAD